MFRSMSRLWGASGKFRVGITILLALVVLAPSPKLHTNELTVAPGLAV